MGIIDKLANERKLEFSLSDDRALLSFDDTADYYRDVVVTKPELTELIDELDELAAIRDTMVLVDQMA